MIKNRKLSSNKAWTSINEWGSVRFSQKPRSMILIFILLMNIILLLVSAWIISRVAIPGNENMGFFTAVYNTITMVLDAGCIESIISDPGNTNLFLIIFCLVLIVISMITFTGALIGYAGNVISNYIEGANANSARIQISDHVVILGWNNRASEMINDLLFCKNHQKVVVLADIKRESIISEVRERMNGTIERENYELLSAINHMSWLKRTIYFHRHKLINQVDVIVREGDIYSAVQLNNIQISKAKSIIILSKDILDDEEAEMKKGDNRTIKTLMQVIDITAKHTSKDNQRVVVEVENDWTGELVNKIIKTKQELGKCRVIPFRVHKVMGQLLSQFSLMPDLNLVYNQLFSNKGVSFFAKEQQRPGDIMKYISDYMNSHEKSIPLTFIKDQVTRQNYFYYMSEEEKKNNEILNIEKNPCQIKLNKNYWISEKNVLILGSNSKMKNIIESFQSFTTEWTNEAHPRILHIVVVDEEDNLKQMNYYKDNPFVEKCIAARVYDQNVISDAITDFIYQHPHDSSILILSDDRVPDEEKDANTMTYLIYAKDIITRVKNNRRDETFNIDIIAEIIEPKHVDLVKSYDVNNVVISNRYISKMVTQISENYALYSLYIDILNYDTMAAKTYEGIEIYTKKAGDYLSELPQKNVRTSDLVRGVFEASRKYWGSEGDFAILLGYIDTRGRLHLFCGNDEPSMVTICKDDNLILFSNH